MAAPGAAAGLLAVLDSPALLLATIRTHPSAPHPALALDPSQRQANAVPASFWTLGFLLLPENRRHLEAVRREVQDAAAAAAAAGAAAAAEPGGGGGDGAGSRQEGAQQEESGEHLLSEAQQRGLLALAVDRRSHAAAAVDEALRLRSFRCAACLPRWLASAGWLAGWLVLAQPQKRAVLRCNPCVGACTTRTDLSFQSPPGCSIDVRIAAADCVLPCDEDGVSGPGVFVKKVCCAACLHLRQPACLHLPCVGTRACQPPPCSCQPVINCPPAIPIPLCRVMWWLFRLMLPTWTPASTSRHPGPTTQTGKGLGRWWWAPSVIVPHADPCCPCLAHFPTVLPPSVPAPVRVRAAPAPPKPTTQSWHGLLPPCREGMRLGRSTAMHGAVVGVGGVPGFSFGGARYR